MTVAVAIAHLVCLRSGNKLASRACHAASGCTVAHTSSFRPCCPCAHSFWNHLQSAILASSHTTACRLESERTDIYLGCAATARPKMTNRGSAGWAAMLVALLAIHGAAGARLNVLGELSSNKRSLLQSTSTTTCPVPSTTQLDLSGLQNACGEAFLLGSACCLAPVKVDFQLPVRPLERLVPTHAHSGCTTKQASYPLPSAVFACGCSANCYRVLRHVLLCPLLSLCAR
jgi:hypothetical protein